MSGKRKSYAESPRTALCYIRKSRTNANNEADLISPERQRENCIRVCEQKGWIAEFYEDVEGHRSGMHEKNRPGWLQLKARLKDGDVVALVANDLSRLHRRGWRIGDLINFTQEHDVHLILADPARQIDFSTGQGIIFAQLTAIFDEWYAFDVSQRWKSSIAFRRSKNITVGLPPFGTKRDPVTHYLMPSEEGVWYVSPGNWILGKKAEEPPSARAVWRGYFDCAHRMMELYLETGRTTTIIDKLYAEGWAFRDRKGKPIPIDMDDIRRVLKNWPEYGGIVLRKPAKDRKYYEFHPDELMLSPERAVMDMNLLKEVGRQLIERSSKHTGKGQSKADFYYPLSQIVYCACCDRVAEEKQNPGLRTRLIGCYKKQYRHRPGLKCGTNHTRIQRTIIEAHVLELCKSLIVNDEDMALMRQLSYTLMPQEGPEQFQINREEEVARCRRKIEAARNLYADGEMSREEYVQKRTTNEQEISRWMAYSTESEQLGMEIMITVDSIKRIVTYWNTSTDEDRQGMIRNLFDYLVWDFDKKEFVDFRLKGAAENYVNLKASLMLYKCAPDRNRTCASASGGPRSIP